jgi:hypothetical protein
MTYHQAMPFLLATIVGMLAGTHAAIWGMYKDAIHEGFGRLRFTRSIIVGGIVAPMIQAAFHLPLPDPAALVVLFGLAYAAERGVVETWKTFVRNEDQSKYFIPMQFGIRGVPLASRAGRLAAGAVWVVVIAAALAMFATLDRGRVGPPDVARTALVGLALGLVVAVGGAWKDAPKEGFQPLKFLRSPAMTVGLALAVSMLTDRYLFIAVAAIGFERATVETYKTFGKPDTPRGKFAGKPITHPAMLVRRRWFVPAYFAIWLAVLASGALALSNRGVPRPLASETSTPLGGLP